MEQIVDINFSIIIVIGFLAQAIDGALGMAYGVSSTTFLTAVGIPPQIASASVHTSEVFTTFVSGISHWKMKNIDRNILKKLVFPGVIGGAIGAYILTSLPVDIISPLVSIYLLIMGIIILIRSVFKSSIKLIEGKKLMFIGLIGGFFDAIGGGGWGPIVTSTIVASGHPPRYAVGSVNSAEFFVTIVQTLTFTIFIGIGAYWKYILGLAIGGIIAAPLAAYVCKRAQPKNLLGLIGVLIIVLNLKKLFF